MAFPHELTSFKDMVVALSETFVMQVELLLTAFRTSVTRPHFSWFNLAKSGKTELQNISVILGLSGPVVVTSSKLRLGPENHFAPSKLLIRVSIIVRLRVSLLHGSLHVVVSGGVWRAAGLGTHLAPRGRGPAGAGR